MHEDNLVQVELNIGGDLPRALLNDFVAKMVMLHNYDPNAFTYKKSYKDNIKDSVLLLIDNAERNNRPFTVTVYLPDGRIELSILMFLTAYNLKYYYRVSPYVESNGTHHNEAVFFYNHDPKYSGGLLTIPTDGEMSPTVLVEDVIEEVKNFFNAYDLDPDDDPTRINENSMVGEVSRRRMSGEPLRKSLIETLEKRIGYPKIYVPHFHVV